jgi:hypothetical protein
MMGKGKMKLRRQKAPGSREKVVPQRRKQYLRTRAEGLTH